jgi:hypothetical protein
MPTGSQSIGQKFGNTGRAAMLSVDEPTKLVFRPRIRAISKTVELQPSGDEILVLADLFKVLSFFHLKERS